jgi:ribosomal protein L23
MEMHRQMPNDLERIAEREALYREQMAAEKAKEIARDEECLQQSKEDLLMLQESMAETKEEIAEVVSKWFSQNEIEPDAVLTTVQKNLLNRSIYLLKHEEEMLAIDIDMAVGKIREASRSLRLAKGNQPTVEEKAQEDAETAAERRFAEVSRRACMPQMVLEDLYESSEYEPDLVSFWNEQADRCQRIIDAREEEMREMMNRQSKSVMV